MFLKDRVPTSIQIAIFSSIYLTLTNTHILTRVPHSLTLSIRLFIIYAFIVKFETFWQFGKCIEVRDDELFIVTAFSQKLIATAMKYLYCCLALIINTIRIETKDAIRNIHFQHTHTQTNKQTNTHIYICCIMYIQQALHAHIVLSSLATTFASKIENSVSCFAYRFVTSIGTYMILVMFRCAWGNDGKKKKILVSKWAHNRTLWLSVLLHFFVFDFISFDFKICSNFKREKKILDTRLLK